MRNEVGNAILANHWRDAGLHFPSNPRRKAKFSTNSFSVFADTVYLQICHAMALLYCCNK